MTQSRDVESIATLPRRGHALSMMDEAKGMPLCRRYQAAYFLQQQASWWEQGATRSGVMYWVIGMAEDGYELLGCWVARTNEIFSWSKVFDDLIVRGLERVRLFVFDDLPEACQAARPAFPDSARLASWPGSQAGYSSDEASAKAVLGHSKTLQDFQSRLSRRVLAGSAAVRGVDRLLSQTVRERAPFDSRDAAMLFLGAELRKAERMLSARGPVRGVGLASWRHSSHGAKAIAPPA
jgi:hypothetical protein